MAGATMHRDVHGAEVYAMPGDRPPLTPEGARRYQQGVFAPALRARFVGGFYNETLTPQLAQQALPARYVDIDCDLYVSTVSVLRWLCQHRLLRAGSLIGYDDWFETPFLRGGESMAHLEVASEHLIHFELIAHSHSGCRQVMFRVRSVGDVAATGISRQLIEQSCEAGPPNAVQGPARLFDKIKQRQACRSRARALLRSCIGPRGASCDKPTQDSGGELPDSR